MSVERFQEFIAGVEHISPIRALIAEIQAVKTARVVQPTDWNFGLTPEQLTDFLETLNAEMAADDHTHDDA